MHLITSVLLARLFSVSFIALKLIFVDLLNSGAEIKLLILGILFLSFVASLSRVALVARLEISGIFFSMSVTSVLRARVVTKQLMLGILFAIAMAFAFRYESCWLVH